jgi:site-specific DNA-methyltransferase (adenine-specific)
MIGTVNRLLFGDNLPWLRDRKVFPDESVDLVYLDPPFNSSADYNVIFREESGEASQAQFHAFTDTWHWADAEPTYREFIQMCPLAEAVTMMEAYRTALKTSPMMAYLAMMAPRLVELWRVLKPTGSIYLHCDPTASHYLKLLMDSIFGPQRFKSEIVWKRTSSHGNVSTGYGNVTDTLLFYSRDDRATWNQLYTPYSQKHMDTKFALVDKDGRRYTTSDLRNPSVRPNLTYEYKGYKPHAHGWAISREKMEEYDRQDRLWFPPKKSGRIRLKRLPG